jgi:hypothetical protein
MRIPGLASLMRFMWPRVPYNLVSAFSRMQHVLKSTTSAASGLAVLA